MSGGFLTRRTRAEFSGAPGAGSRGRSRTGTGTLTAAAVAASAAVGGWALGYGPLSHHPRPGISSDAIPTSTAAVVRTTITAAVEDPGTITYDGSFTIYDGQPGTVTWLPAAGSVISPGQVLFAVNGQDAVLFAGQEPAWRAFAPGMSDGPDVRELEQNLAALGYDPNHVMTIGDHYDWATQEAVQRWQQAQGMPAAQQDGQIPFGQVTFLPQPVRVAALSTGAGATADPGTPLFTATSTTPVADVAMPADEESLVHPGQRVSITLPDGTATPGRVLRIDQAVTGGQNQGPSPASGQSQQATPQTVTVVVALIQPANVMDLNQAAIQVAIATQVARNVLAVPISALLAKPGGGYQVTVVRGRTRRNVTVQTGLFDELDGTVAISGPGLTDGTVVEVPSS